MNVNSTRALAVALSIVLAIVLSGCTNSPVDAGSNDPLDIDAFLDRTTEYQHAIISDGEVSASEYERALLARYECVRAAGAVPGEIYEIGNGELTFDYDVDAPSDAARIEIELAAESCIPEYFSEVGAIWAYQQLLSPEQRESELPIVLACLRTAGAELRDSASLEEIMAAIGTDNTISAAEQDCIDDHPAFFSTWTNSQFDEAPTE